MAKKQDKKKKEDEGIERVVSENRRARFDYDILESLECGIALVGSEVKSLRAGTISLAESYARIRQNEVFLVNCDIPEYIDANRFNHFSSGLLPLDKSPLNAWRYDDFCRSFCHFTAVEVLRETSQNV